MTITEKIRKTSDNEIEQNKAQYGLDRQTGKISGNVSKYEYLTGKYVYQKKTCQEKLVQ